MTPCRVVDDEPLSPTGETSSREVSTPMHSVLRRVRSALEVPRMTSRRAVTAAMKRRGTGGFPRLSTDGKYFFFLKLVSVPWQCEVFWVSVDALTD